MRIGGTVINNIRFADDTAIMAENIEDLQILLERINNESKKMGLTINIDKTKYMVVSKTPVDNIHLTLEGKQLERVDRYKYLGTTINSQLDQEEEIKIRIEIARQGFIKYRSMFTNKNLSLNIRSRFLECYVWSQLLYGVETWTLKAQSTKRLEAFEMWLYRRMLKIPWTAKVTNEEVLRRIGRRRKLMMIVKIRKTTYLGHILRNDKYSLLHVIMQGRIEGKKGIGRKKKSWLRDIREWTNLNADQIFHVAKDREAFKVVVANLR